MILPIFSSFIIFVLILNFLSKRASKKDLDKDTAFWIRERQANSVRKKSIDDLEYLSIPFDEFPMDAGKDDETIAGYLNELLELKEEKIVNFTGYTNTDLKLAYGVANLTALSQYDQNYTLMVRLLQDLGNALYKKGMIQDALTVLEYSVKTRCDVSATYYLLAQIYIEQGQPEKIKKLILRAETIQSLMQPTIVRKLQELYPCND